MDKMDEIDKMDRIEEFYYDDMSQFCLIRENKMIGQIQTVITESEVIAKRYYTRSTKKEVKKVISITSLTIETEYQNQGLGIKLLLYCLQTLIKKYPDIQYSVLDDCSTGHADSVPAGIDFIKGSILDGDDVAKALRGCDAVIHFAGKSLVGESVKQPDLYRKVNVAGTRNLLDGMHKHGIKKLVFSSSAATYGEPNQVPITEDAPTVPTNPYGETKLEVDQMISIEAQSRGIAAVSLRYFNVAGAHESKRGWLAERHNPETHLIPNVLRSTKDKPVEIYGTDWPTADGTCVRDYVHVVDLIDAHIKALISLESGVHEIYNLGSGDGYSVKVVLAAASKVIGFEIPTIVAPRRAGDPAVLIADISKAKEKLSWAPTHGIERIVADTLKSFS
jgi:UDP-glucose 4-epimerase